MKLKVDNIIYMTLFDKEHNPLWNYNDVENVSLECEPEEIIGKPKIGERVTITGNIGNEKIIEVDGIFGGIIDDQI